MSEHIYPVHLHRRFEQRWAARFGTATALKPTKPRKNVVKVPRRHTTIETHPIIKKAS